jgi:transcriptional regulator GlxA family with amidase domain
MASVSERHLNRLFLTEMGMGPARFVQRVRVEAARAALERREKSIESVAMECGFGSAETMRRAFLRVLGVSPSAYRDRSSGCTQC